MYVRFQLRYVPLHDGHCVKRGENFVTNYATTSTRLKATAHEELPLGWLKNLYIKIYMELHISSWLRMVKPTELNISEF